MKKVIGYVALILFPTTAFASTATSPLADSTRDIFDNMDENPAFVNTRENKSYLRIGKEGSLQAIANTGSYGLAVQVNTLKSTLVVPLDGSSKDITSANTALAASGFPLRLTLGTLFGDDKYGLRVNYQDSKISGPDGVFPFGFSFRKLGLGWGIISGPTQVSLNFNRNDWKLATTSTQRGLAGDATVTLDDGMSDQTTDQLNLSVIHKIEKNRWFVAIAQSKTKAGFWDKKAAATTKQDNLNKLISVYTGAQRDDKLTDAATLFSRAWVGWSKTTDNVSKQKKETTDVNVGWSNGLEYSSSSWSVLRAGFQAMLYDNIKATTTVYSDVNQSGASISNTTSKTNFVKGLGAPLLGAGLKFGNTSIDATLAQNNTSDVGFSDNVFGKVELTVEF
ncbi:MAG: hypothetical protein EBR09_04900 [Proteobacteria bacterium]|nr:hypothetical protein [Pseudomonadota bacterium]